MMKMIECFIFLFVIDMLIRVKSKMSVEIEAYIDQVIKTLALKEDTNSLKVLINDQNQLLISLDLKVLKLEEKVKKKILQ